MNDYPDNTDRARWAVSALTEFAEQTGQINDFPLDEEIFPEVAGDLICNLMHLADMYGIDPELILDRGRGHHDTEQNDWPET